MVRLQSIKKQKGFAIVETLISIAIIGILLIGFQILISQAIKVNRVNRTELKASLYLQETIEIAKDLELSDWDTLTGSSCISSSVCHPIDGGGSWALSNGQEFLDSGKYSRDIYIEDVCRDSSDFPNNIIDCPGLFNDPNTKKVVATVQWNDSYRPRSLSLETYVYKYEE